MEAYHPCKKKKNGSPEEGGDGETGQSARAIKRREREKEDCGGNCLLFLYGPLPGRSVGPSPLFPLDWCGPLAKKRALFGLRRAHLLRLFMRFLFFARPSRLAECGSAGVKAGRGDMGDQDQRESPPPVASPH